MPSLPAPLLLKSHARSGPSAGFCLAVMTGVLKIDIKEVPFSSGIELGLS